MPSVKKVFTLYNDFTYCTATIVLHASDQILQKINEAGFNISLSTETCLTKEMAEQLYSEHKDKGFYEELTDFMCR